MQQISEVGYMRIGQVLALCPVGKSTLWLWCREGKFPAPVKLGPRTTAWSRSSVMQWLRERGVAEEAA